MLFSVSWASSCHCRGLPLKGGVDTEGMEVRENAIVDSRNAGNPIRRLRLEEDLSGDIPGDTKHSTSEEESTINGGPQ